MILVRIAKNTLVTLLAVAVAATGCSTAQMQQMKEERNNKLQAQYTSFNSCFKEEKVAAIASMALLGALVGKVAGGSGGKGNTAAALGAVLGGIVGNKIAWGNCLDAFATKPQIIIVNDRATVLAQSGQTSNQVNVKSLTIRSVSASPLIFGKDLEVAVTYSYVSDNPAARDIKARVSRNLTFTAPDGSRQDVVSNTEDTIQQGISKATFAIPTPSLEDAQELQSTKDWAFKLIVEVDGMRQEKVVPLTVGHLSNAKAQLSHAPVSMSQNAASVPIDAETIILISGTKLFKATNSPVVVAVLKKRTSVKVVQRSLVGKVKWVQVQTPDGKEGWFKDTSK